MMDEESSQDENVAPPTLDEMVKIFSGNWKSLDKKTRNEWNKKGQRVGRMKILGWLTKKKECQTCGKGYNRETSRKKLWDNGVW